MEDQTKIEVKKEFSRVEFYEKAAECDFNSLWKCTHVKQKGIKCEKLCKHFAVNGQAR
jgi:hypothetical protein